MAQQRAAVQQETLALFDALKKEWAAGNKSDLAKCGQLLAQLKVGDGA